MVMHVISKFSRNSGSRDYLYLPYFKIILKLPDINQFLSYLSTDS